ncbi:MAG TPA: tetratricopeptide repeat protein, partial [Chthonomonadaceae bacterium]|nr:tetratricopeptide repeat protein [Chthonomonadaceae bacterium]
DPAAGFLKEYARYQQASVAYAWLDFPRALTLYQQFLNDFPKSAKREAGLLMLARCALRPQVAESTRADVGKQALDQLFQEFPHTRYADAAQGLQGRLYYLTGRYADAVRCYLAIHDMESATRAAARLPANTGEIAHVSILEGHLRRLLTVSNLDRYQQSVLAINGLAPYLTKTERAQFSHDVLQDPELAAPYLYYRLYHCDNKPSDLQHMVALAESLIARHSTAQLSPLVRVRLAEVYYQNRRYDQALDWANRALAAAPQYDRALFVHGATQHKRHEYHVAIADFKTLLRDCPGSSLQHGAWEELAILDETVGDMGGALEQYLALNYRPDIAYLLDAKMTIPQIEAYYKATPEDLSDESHFNYSYEDSSTLAPPSYKRRDLLAYTIGIRYLRQEQWDQADLWLKRVPAEKLKAFNKGREEWGSKPSPDPLTASHELHALQHTASEAKTEATRAEALFRYASYYYSHGTLLLYNPMLWQEERAFNFSMYWDKKQPTPEDLSATKRYMYSHEVYAHTRALCLEIARRYPDTPTAPKALYRAACSDRYLATFNGWWREENAQEDHWKEAARLMRELAQRYPHDPLAADAKKFAGVFTEERKGMQW